jgi:hypothetical protein
MRKFFISAVLALFAVLGLGIAPASAADGTFWGNALSCQAGGWTIDGQFQYIRSYGRVLWTRFAWYVGGGFPSIERDYAFNALDYYAFSAYNQYSPVASSGNVEVTAKWEYNATAIASVWIYYVGYGTVYKCYMSDHQDL